MQSQPPAATKVDDHDPYFVVSIYPNGLMTVAVEGSGDKLIGGVTLLSFHEYRHRVRPFKHHRCSGPSFFEGSYDEHRGLLKKWGGQVRKNKRRRSSLKVASKRS